MTAPSSNSPLIPQADEEIVKLIIQDQMPIGEKLTLADLAMRLHCSSTQASIAVGYLIHCGVMREFYLEQSNGPYYYQVVPVTPIEASASLQLCSEIEQLIAEELVAHAKPRDLQHLESVLAEMDRQSKEEARFLQTDAYVRCALVSIAGYLTLVPLMRGHTDRLRIYNRRKAISTAEREILIRGHRQVVESMRLKNTNRVIEALKEQHYNYLRILSSG